MSQADAMSGELAVVVHALGGPRFGVSSGAAPGTRPGAAWVRIQAAGIASPAVATAAAARATYAALVAA